MFCNAEIILTKNTVIKKTVALLAGVQEQLMTANRQHQFSSTPKISKGENYLGLPYVVLDYPRVAGGEGLLFIRSMFWWGHFFSSTLQVSGLYKEENELKLAAAYDILAAGHYFVGVGKDPWQHHFEASNYRKIADFSHEDFYQVLQQQPYIKIAARWPLSAWDSAAAHLTGSWTFYTGLIA